jgi:coenzyme Q-binding protein COQ10
LPKFSITRRVNLSVDQAFAIAADVTSYKDFLPLLKRSVIRGEKKRIGNVETFDADLQVAFEKLGLRETFTSQVTSNAADYTVTATSSDGPMKSLKAVWKIVGVENSITDVSITVDYTMKSMMLQMVAGGLTDFAAQKIMQAFEERGKALYGRAVS